MDDTSMVFPMETSSINFSLKIPPSIMDIISMARNIHEWTTQVKTKHTVPQAAMPLLYGGADKVKFDELFKVQDFDGDNQQLQLALSFLMAKMRELHTIVSSLASRTSSEHIGIIQKMIALTQSYFGQMYDHPCGIGGIDSYSSIPHAYPPRREVTGMMSPPCIPRRGMHGGDMAHSFFAE